MRLNEVHKSIEGTAHGFFSLGRYEFFIALLVGLLFIVLVHPLAGIGATIMMVIALSQGRKLDNHRRDYLKLWFRRLDNTKHYRLLDTDKTFKPWR